MWEIAWASLGPYKKSSIALFLLLLLGAFLETLSIGMVLPILDVTLNPTQSPTGITRYLVRVLDHFSIESRLMPLCIMTLVLFLIKNGIVIIRSYHSHKFLANLREHWSSLIFDNYMFADYHAIMSHRKGTLLNNVINEPNFASKCLRDAIEILAKSSLSVCIVGLLLIVSWPVTVVGLGLGGLLTAMQWRSTRRYSYQIGKKKIELNQSLNALTSESLAGIRQIKIFSLEQTVADLFRRQINYLVNLFVKIGVVGELPKVLGEIIIIGFLMIGIIAFDYFKTGEIQSVIPMAGVFLVSLQRLFMSFSGILSERISVLSYIPSLQLVYNLLRRQISREERAKGKNLKDLSGDIEFKEINFSYSPAKPLFENLNLTIGHHAITAITGPSGSGKSTICDMLIGFFKPQSGRLLAGGEDLEGINLKSWRDLIGYVSQENFLFNMSIRENILSGRPDASEEDMIIAAQRAGAHEFIQGFPERYDTVTGESGSLLSGGQLQRIAIARALVRNPAILVFDEATSALDTQNEESILRLIEDLKQSKTIVLISHRLSSLAIADIIYVLDDGRIVESGRFSDLMKERGLFWKLNQTGKRLP